MKRALATLYLAPALLVVGCGVDFEPTNVRQEFQKGHPDYTITYVGFPDGRAGSDIVVVPIVYKKPGDEREYCVWWDYQFKDGKHRLVGKGSERLCLFSSEPSTSNKNHVGVK